MTMETIPCTACFLILCQVIESHLQYVEHEHSSNGRIAAFRYSDGTASCVLIKHVDIARMHRPNLPNVKALMLNRYKKSTEICKHGHADIRPSSM